jgi:hypothetical protein
MRGVAIVLGGAQGEIRRQLAAALLQPLVIVAEREIHPSPFLPLPRLLRFAGNDN